MFKSLVMSLYTLSTVCCCFYSHATQYQISQIMCASEETRFLTVHGINGSGVVLGSYVYDQNTLYDDDRHYIGFVWDQEIGKIEFAIAQDNLSDLSLRGINDSGNVLFEIDNKNYTWNREHGFDAVTFGLHAGAINNNGDIILMYSPSKEDRFVPVSFYFDLGNKVEYIGSSNDALSEVLLNDKKYLLLNSKFGWSLWNQSGQTLKQISPKDSLAKNCSFIEATALNNLNDVAGYEYYDRYFGTYGSYGSSNKEKLIRGVLWTSDNEKIEINSPSRCKRPLGINDKRQVVGSTYSADNLSEPKYYFSNQRAFIWDQENGLQDLNKYIPSDSNWILKDAIAINNKGQIVVEASRDNIEAILLLTPISE